MRKLQLLSFLLCSVSSACQPRTLAEPPDGAPELLPVIEAVSRFQPRPNLVLDSLQLRRTLHLSSADLASLAKSLEGVARIGDASPTGTCAERAAPCTKLAIGPVTYEADAVLLEATWSGVKECESYAILELKVRRTDAKTMGVERLSQITGHCYP